MLDKEILGYIKCVSTHKDGNTVIRVFPIYKFTPHFGICCAITRDDLFRLVDYWHKVQYANAPVQHHYSVLGHPYPY